MGTGREGRKGRKGRKGRVVQFNQVITVIILYSKNNVEMSPIHC